MLETANRKTLMRTLLWAAYAAGSLALLLALLLAQTARPSQNAHLTLDYFFWTVAAMLMGVTLLLGWRIRKIGEPEESPTPPVVMQGMLVAASLELVFAVYAMATLVVYGGQP